MTTKEKEVPTKEKEVPTKEKEAPVEEKEETTQPQINFLIPDDMGSRKSKMRIVGLYGDVGSDKCAELVYNLFLMHHEAPHTRLVNPEDPNCEEEETVMDPFKLILCTPGGQTTDMFSVYDAIRIIREDCKIEVLGLGEVMSAGVLLLAAGTKGERKVGKNCRLMLHSVSAGSHGSIDSLETEVAEVKWIQKKYIEALAAETKMSEKQIKKIISKKVNHYLDAEEAVKLGIADEVV